MILSQNCIDFDTKTHRFGHISGPSYREHMLAGRLAGWSAECQQCVWDTKMRKKGYPFIKKCVENATPHAVIACLDALPQALESISGRRKSYP